MYTKEYRQEEIKGWGNFPKARANVFRPERVADISEMLVTEKATVLARGGGTSYGDASINTVGLNIDMLRINKFLHFDDQSGMLHCQAGVTLFDIIKTFLPRGWFLNVTPGSQFSTVGGCIACDAHGKNWEAGSFGSYVRGLSLMLPDGSTMHCDDERNSDMFYATIGGMGMTGIIVDARIQLKKISSSYMDIETIRFNNLKELFDLQKESMASHHYIFSWLDSHREGKEMGRGILQRAVHGVEEDLLYIEKRKINIPLYFPHSIVNKYSVEAFNNLYYAKVGSGIKNRKMYLVDFFYPLDSIGNWYRIYGRKGFIEYQIAVPSNRAYDACHEILTVITRSKLGSTVAAIKPMIESKGLISFPLNGFTLAVDFAYSDKLWRLLDDLDNIVIQSGGRVYLSKDARLTAQNFRKMYSETFSTWESVRKQFNVSDKFASLMFNRLHAS